MRKLGLDFGTTNSTLTFQQGDVLAAFKYGGAAATNYIPSCVSIERDDPEHIKIGHTALLDRGDDDFQVFQHFKLLLEEHDPNVLSTRGYEGEHTPQTITKRYLQALLDAYRKDQQLTEPLQKLVITVPEVWVRQGSHAAREHLKTICRDLGLPVKIHSEPVAAVVYFAHRYRQRYEKDFNGHVLVCDYGGGTLDLSLSAVEGDQVRVLEGTGTSKAKNSLGQAGVAYDEAVVHNILQREQREITDYTRHKLQREFEHNKISRTEQLAKPLKNYRRDHDLNKTVFRIGDNIEVTSQDLVATFDHLIAPALNNALEEMRSYFPQYDVNTQDADKFRILLVGGFSNFCLVQTQVEQFFHQKSDADRRFEHCFDAVDTALAISKGAALIANSEFVVNTTCPISVGVRAVNNKMEYENTRILKKGDAIKDYIKPVFSRRQFTVTNENALNEASLTLFIDIGRGKHRYVNLKGNLRRLLPNPDINNRWQFGFSVDEDLMFSMHVRDQTGASKATSLAELFERLNELQVWED